MSVERSLLLLCDISSWRMAVSDCFILRIVSSTVHALSCFYFPGRYLLHFVPHRNALDVILFAVQHGALVSRNGTLAAGFTNTVLAPSDPTAVSQHIAFGFSADLFVHAGLCLGRPGLYRTLHATMRTLRALLRKRL